MPRLAVLLLVAVVVGAGEAIPTVRGLPDPKPPFSAGEGRRVLPALTVVQVGDIRQPGFHMGSKRVGVREARLHGRLDDHDHEIAIMVDGRRLARLVFSGAVDGLGGGLPFKDLTGQPTRLEADPGTGTITFTKPYALSGGGQASFTYVLRALDEGRVEVAWDTGSPAEVRPELLFQGSGGYREVGVAVDGTAFVLPALDAVMAKGFYQNTPVWSGSGATVLCSPQQPLRGMALVLPAATAWEAGEYKVGETTELRVRAASSRKGSAIIDCGASLARAADAPPALGGIDFWALDAFDVSRPPGRNLLHNPGFEQGLRYWSWWWGGARTDATRPAPYAVAEGGRFGRRSLEIRPYDGVLALMGFPVPVEKGRTYTLSFHARGEAPTQVTCAVIGMTRGSRFQWPGSLAAQRYAVGTEWERRSFTFEADSTGIMLNLSAGGHAWIDGMQLEEGAEATAVDSPAVEGALLTADAGNALEAGRPFDARLVLSGAPGARGAVRLSFRDFYRTEVLRLDRDYVLDADGAATIALPVEKDLGRGFFTLRAEYRPAGAAPAVEYHRLSVFASLDHAHPTRTLFGNSVASHYPRSEELGRMYRRWGWGYHSYSERQPQMEFLARHGIASWPAILTPPPYYAPGGRLAELPDEARRKRFIHIAWEQEDVSEDDLRLVEEVSYEVAKAQPWLKHWAFGCESEGHCLMIRKRNFAGWARMMKAFTTGVRRACPDAQFWPDAGTTGWSTERGYAEMDGYLSSTRGLITWDAIGIHPYGNIDGACATKDIDIETPKLITLMAKHGYGPKTPIDIDEAFGERAFNLPVWETGGDDHPVTPTYDLGWREFLTTARAARVYLLYLKYWPQVRTVNIWRARPFIDQDLTGLALCVVPNTLGNLFPDARFTSDIRPAAGIRGCAFDVGDSTVAAVWSAIDRVDEGYEKGPEIDVAFGSLKPEVIDLMGGRRVFVPRSTGTTPLRLTPAPLFLRVPRSDGARLAEALNQAEVSGVGSAVRLAVLPQVDGSLVATLANQTGRTQTGNLRIEGKAVPFSVAPAATAELALPYRLDPVAGRLTPWRQTIGVEFANGRRDEVRWDLSGFFVPRTAKPLPLDPDAAAWRAIPAIPLATRHGLTSDDDLTASVQVAWDAEALYVRVEGRDDRFIGLPPDAKGWDPRHLYRMDGTIELYFDTIASGRSNLAKGYDQYDYRYDLAPGSATAQNGPGTVNRFQEVFCQLAGGMAMPTKDQAAQGVRCEFRRDGNAYRYAIVLPQLFIEPLRLEKGWRAGFGVHLHDHDPGAGYKGLSMATDPAERCNGRPDLWPIMVLAGP